MGDGSDWSSPGSLSRITRSVAPGKQWVATLKKRVFLIMESSTIRVVGSGWGDVGWGFVGQDKGQASGLCEEDVEDASRPSTASHQLREAHSVGCRLLQRMVQFGTRQSGRGISWVDRIVASQCSGWRSEDGEVKQARPSSSCNLNPSSDV